MEGIPNHLKSDHSSIETHGDLEISQFKKTPGREDDSN